MDTTALRRQTLRSFIVFLVLTAAVAIAALLGGEFGETQMRVLGTTFTISAASICSMSCAAFMERGRAREAGLGGILLCVVAAGLVITGIWTKTESEPYWKTTGTAITGAVALAHAFLLLLPDLSARGNRVQRAAVYGITLLAAQILVAMWWEIEDEGYYRVLASVAVVVALLTLVVPILARLRRGEGGAADRLVLERGEDGTFRDAAGRRYEVREVEGGGP